MKAWTLSAGGGSSGDDIDFAILCAVYGVTR
jgi:hypothetical protein